MALISLAGADGQFIQGGIGRAVPRYGEQKRVDWGLCSEVVVSGRRLVIDDVQNDVAHRSGLTVAATGMRAFMGVPLLLDELSIGALYVIDTRPRLWDTGQRRSLNNWASR